MKTTFLKRTAAASLSVVLAASVPFTVLADQTDPNVAYEQEQQLLSDGHLDYGEIEGRVKNYYGPMKSAYDMAKGMVEDQADIAVNERIMANDLLSQADVAEDMAEEQTGSGDFCGNRQGAAPVCQTDEKCGIHDGAVLKKDLIYGTSGRPPGQFPDHECPVHDESV